MIFFVNIGVRDPEKDGDIQAIDVCFTGFAPALIVTFEAYDC
jgi:hypothetical protein